MAAGAARVLRVVAVLQVAVGLVAVAAGGSGPDDRLFAGGEPSLPSRSDPSLIEVPATPTPTSQPTAPTSTPTPAVVAPAAIHEPAPADRDGDGTSPTSTTPPLAEMPQPTVVQPAPTTSPPSTTTTLPTLPKVPPTAPPGPAVPPPGWSVPAACLDESGATLDSRTTTVEVAPGAVLAMTVTPCLVFAGEVATVSVTGSGPMGYSVFARTGGVFGMTVRDMFFDAPVRCLVPQSLPIRVEIRPSPPTYTRTWQPVTLGVQAITYRIYWRTYAPGPYVPGFGYCQQSAEGDLFLSESFVAVPYLRPAE